MTTNTPDAHTQPTTPTTPTPATPIILVSDLIAALLAVGPLQMNAPVKFQLGHDDKSGALLDLISGPDYSDRTGVVLLEVGNPDVVDTDDEDGQTD